MSASMTRERLQNVKKAMLAVIKDLGPRDRFSMLSFSSEVQSRTELTEMSLNGKEAASSMVQNLVTGGKTDMGAALQQAAKVRFFYKLVNIRLFIFGSCQHLLIFSFFRSRF
jgi:Mg-chelatase subunit ChlD